MSSPKMLYSYLYGKNCDVWPGPMVSEEQWKADNEEEDPRYLATEKQFFEYEDLIPKDIYEKYPSIDHYQMYPDIRIRLRLKQQVPLLYDWPDRVGHSMDTEPLSLSSNLQILVKSNYTAWAALFDHHADIDQSPHLRFDRVLLSARKRKNNDAPWEDFFYEVSSSDELANIVRMRRRRYNAIINAKHLVRTPWRRLVKTFSETYIASDASEYNPNLGDNNPRLYYQPFVDNVRAMESFDIEGKMKEYAQEYAQRPAKKKKVSERKVQALHELRHAAGRRLHHLTGRTGWYGDLTWQGYDTSAFVRLIDEATALIQQQTTVAAIDTQLTNGKNRINDFYFPFSSKVETTPLEDRQLQIAVHVSQPASVRLTSNNIHATFSPKASQDIATVGCVLFTLSVLDEAPANQSITYTILTKGIRGRDIHHGTVTL